MNRGADGAPEDLKEYYPCCRTVLHFRTPMRLTPWIVLAACAGGALRPKDAAAQDGRSDLLLLAPTG